MDEAYRLKNHRIHIVHGRNDTVCLPRAASRLRAALTAGREDHLVTLEFVEAAGHSDSEPPISFALREAADLLAAEL